MSFEIEYAQKYPTLHIMMIGASTTQYQAYGMPCVVCGYPAQEIVTDYVQEGEARVPAMTDYAEGDNLVTQHLVPLCEAHMREPLFTWANGSTEDLDTARGKIRARFGLHSADDEEEGED